MYVLGWLLILVGVVFGVMGGVANLFLAQNYGEFWMLNLPVAVLGLGLGRYLVERVERGAPDVSRQ
ncbi:MAG: hypothetical protein ACYC5Q_08680 [Thermoleophilia bacterium]|jgi:hypothetical protein